jgi:hypothetical protein
MVTSYKRKGMRTNAKVQTVSSILESVPRCSPIGNDGSLEVQLAFEDLVLKVFVLASVDPVHCVVSTLNRAYEEVEGDQR